MRGCFSDTSEPGRASVGKTHRSVGSYQGLGPPGVFPLSDLSTLRSNLSITVQVFIPGCCFLERFLLLGFCLVSCDSLYLLVSGFGSSSLPCELISGDVHFLVCSVFHLLFGLSRNFQTCSVCNRKLEVCITF